ncbi:GTPase Era [Radicibacter daui]|uniref:GTPase Era n=1 Tax=Radicibacter daui TaxID=3064829 RepID=UPI004046B21B
MTETEKAGEVTRCGFVALLGAPNAGKSTLLNRLVGSKISIVTPKVQTTRSRVLGILMHDHSQIIFVDTPGLFKPKKRLERAMVAAAWGGAQDADMSVLVVDVSRKDPMDDNADIIDALKAQGRPVILALNKIDLMDREKLLKLSESFWATGVFSDVFMISAHKGHGVPHLAEFLAGKVPQGPYLYDEDQLSDMPMRLIAAEVTREKLFLNMHDELPYSLTVETESWEDKGERGIRIEQTIYVQREGQRKIVLGEGGQAIRKIGTQARAELTNMMERPVHLFLFVKVREDWQDDKERYAPWGLDWGA